MRAAGGRVLCEPAAAAGQAESLLAVGVGADEAVVRARVAQAAFAGAGWLQLSYQDLLFREKRPGGPVHERSSLERDAGRFRQAQAGVAEDVSHHP